VAHVVRENVQRDVRNRFEDLAVAQAGGASARQVRIAEFPALNDDATREFKDGIGARVGRAGANRIIDFSLISARFQRL
jgi:hypothetical protein